jgi:hypothetical protein
MASLKDKLTKSDDEKDDDKGATSTGRRSTVKAPDSPGDVPQTDDLGAGDVHRHRDAISHNLLGTPSDPVDPISHNPVGPGEAYEGDADLDISSILDDEDALKAQLRALPTERLHILYHAVQGESASR